MTNPTDSTPRLSLQDFEQRFQDRHLLHGAVEKWTREKPEAVALIDAERDRKVTWAEFDAITRALAMVLLRRGFSKGDFFASLLPLTSEHIFLEYACFRIGAIFVPLDLRLTEAELMRSLTLVQPAGIAFVRTPGLPDAGRFCAEVQKRFPMKLTVQFAAPEDCAAGAVSVATVLGEAMGLLKARGDEDWQTLQTSYAEAAARVTPEDGALVIFTTGSTGSPKPALLSHRNISCQAMCLSQALLSGSERELATLVNLPPSHVGCQTELLMGTIFDGGRAVLVSIFDPLRSVRAIADYGVTALGQIPAMFEFEWRLKEFDSFDFSSLEFAAYGGQQVSPMFLEKMAKMAPNVGTGLGLTEAAGFCTYLRVRGERAADCASSLGYDMPVYPMTIRAAMQADGAAGEEQPDGTLGHVCFRGPQTFLGYVNDPAATAEAISSDGYLYTGDMGYRDEAGLHLAGRAKLMMKPAGYQVFPGDIENHFCGLPGVAQCAAVGVPHPVISEAIVAFVETRPGSEVERSQLERHARGLASYMRPHYYVLLEAGQMPLNRMAKADYLVLRERALRETEALRERGRWMASPE
ncbi:MAG: class I adenylate-forming enzyme family protein [Candidatus Korobacteraceae bacterium]